jgi:hypothetical protein
MPTRQGTGWHGLSAWRAAELVVGFWFLGSSFVAMNAKPDRGVASAVGALVGVSALGAFVRWLWVRFGPGSTPVLDPPHFVLVSGVLAVISTAS